MRSRVSILLILATFAAAAPTLSAPPDPLCDQIVVFAAATPDGAVRRIRYETDWGGLYVSDSRVVVSAHCDDGETEPGKALCAFLMHNASVEFPKRNLMRALRCLHGEAYADGDNVVADYVRAEFTAISLAGVRDEVAVSVGFASATDTAPATLTITADAIESTHDTE